MDSPHMGRRLECDSLQCRPVVTHFLGNYHRHLGRHRDDGNRARLRGGGPTSHRGHGGECDPGVAGCRVQRRNRLRLRERADTHADDAQEIARRCPGVEAVTPIVRARTQIIYGNRNWVPIFISGTSPEFLKVRDWEPLDDGTMFTEREVRTGNQGCLAGRTIVRELFQGRSPIGAELRIQNVPFRVVGILRHKAANMMGMDQDDIRQAVHAFGFQLLDVRCAVFPHRIEWLGCLLSGPILWYQSVSSRSVNLESRMFKRPVHHSRSAIQFDTFARPSSAPQPAEIATRALRPRRGGRSRRILAVLLFAICSACGCAREPAQFPSAELPLDEQIAAVRSGRSDRVSCALASLDSDIDGGRRQLDGLAALSTLRVLQLDHSDNRISPTDAARLLKLPELEHIRLRGVAVDDATIAGIPTTSKLRIINLPNADLTDAGFACLQRLPKLEQLRLRSPRVSATGLQALKTFPSLLRLHLIDVPVTDAGLRIFQELPKLQSLYLDGATVSDLGYDALFAARPDLHVHLNQRHHDRDPHVHPH